jgi:hypothetical protein
MSATQIIPVTGTNPPTALVVGPTQSVCWSHESPCLLAFQGGRLLRTDGTSAGTVPITGNRERRGLFASDVTAIRLNGQPEAIFG